MDVSELITEFRAAHDHWRNVEAAIETLDNDLLALKAEGDDARKTYYTAWNELQKAILA